MAANDNHGKAFDLSGLVVVNGLERETIGLFIEKRQESLSLTWSINGIAQS